MKHTDLLIVGAGPFGLAVAAKAAASGIDYLMIGKSMEFWRRNMPRGMFLRSACDWHLDPAGLHTIEDFLTSQGKTSKDVEPLSLDFYLEYVEWFRSKKQIEPIPVYIRQLDYLQNEKRFVATTFEGESFSASNVVLAPGFRHFPNIPAELKTRLPAGRFQHTCEFVDFSKSAGKRYLIIGGRQSAFEWAALLVEAGAEAVYLVHRHDSPAFKTSDWSWVSPLVQGMADNPGWFRNLSQSEKDSVSHRQWAEGRLKVEPWLESRLPSDRVHIWPRTEVESCVDEGDLRLKLSNGETLSVDQVILATGYKVNIRQLPYLAAGNVLPLIETRNDFPVLDEHFETSLRGLFITSFPATQDFGPFFGFTIAVRVSAELIIRRLLDKASQHDRAIAKN
jgi:cation diffusion facilitator CzcD-associated flavoprotein CzcO